MITLSGCYTTTYFVECIHKIDEGYSNPRTDNEVVTELSYSDEYLTIIPYSEYPRIELVLINNHTSSIHILWDEAAYTDVRGKAHRIIHNNTKFIDREKAQVASVIPAGAKIEDVIVPTECIAMIDGEWEIIPFESDEFLSLEDAEAELYAYQNNPGLSKCSLLLPIEIEGKKIEYTLNFTGKNFSINSIMDLDKESTNAAIAAITSIGIFAMIFIL
jgi:hypothetical protein